MSAMRVTEQLGDYLREQRESAKLSLRQLAEAAGVSNPYLSQVERGLRKPSAEVLQQIAKGLRISAEALYVRAGLLEDHGDRIQVETAVLADPHLTERQRQVLLDIYTTFRTENEREGAASQGVVEAVDEALAGAAATQQGGRATATKRTPTKRTPTKRTPTKRTPTKQTGTKQTGTKRVTPKPAATTRTGAKRAATKRTPTKTATTRTRTPAKRPASEGGN
ncbi:helix-turn-helix domain-containing protein [Quadrisphaera sp. GCM10027208]|jgi:transcriptional regulator with XRE-family HTH domain|uniref:helix-turn-helix domain-containing protein n=1 Tax=Quadrisphaera sp. GCM10027208 TaxID=3273423 RepID=UPI003618B422